MSVRCCAAPSWNDVSPPSPMGLAAAYGIYTAMAVLSVFFVLKFVYETKGRELEQMEG